MHHYIIKRLILMITTIIGISFIVFTIMSFTPGSPGRIILGDLATKEQIDLLNEELGFNRPFIVRYVDYMQGALRGDLGKSYRTSMSVSSEIARRYPTTLKIAVLSVLFSIIVGIPIGIISAVKQYSLIDSISTVFALIFISTPTFWLGLMLILFFSLHLGWFPSYGSDTLWHLILPALANSAATFARLIRMTRSSMLEVIRQDYIRTARAKGVRERVVIYKHCLRNALIPIVTIIGVSFGYMLGGAIITENVFGISGVGQLLLNAVRVLDVPVVMGSVLVFAVSFSAIILMLDIIYTIIDPRIKKQYQQG